MVTKISRDKNTSMNFLYLQDAFSLIWQNKNASCGWDNIGKQFIVSFAKHQSIETADAASRLKIISYKYVIRYLNIAYINANFGCNQRKTLTNN